MNNISDVYNKFKDVKNPNVHQGLLLTKMCFEHVLVWVLDRIGSKDQLFTAYKFHIPFKNRYMDCLMLFT